MRGYSIMSDEERQSILQQHSSLYDGYSVGNVPSNMTPLSVYDPAGDKEGVTVNNKGEVTGYKNHMVNESKVPVETNEMEADDMDVSNVDPADNFKSGGPEQFADSDPDKDPYDMDLEAIMRMFDYGDDEKESFDFESEGGNVDVYGESVVREQDESLDGLADRIMRSKIFDSLANELEPMSFSDEFEFADNFISYLLKDYIDEEYYDDLYDLIKDEYGDFILSMYGTGGFEDDEDMFMEEKESMCEQCGLSESMCECGMYEEMDDELHESFRNEKQKITEMFNRIKKYK